MELSVKTIYTKELLMDFHWFSIKRKGFFWTFMLLCDLLFSTYSIYMFIRYLEPTFLIVLPIVAAYNLFVLLVNFVLPRFRIKKATNLGTELTFTFFENEFMINAIGKFGTENSTIKYEALKKAIKSGDRLYLFINKINAFIVVLDEINYEDLNFLKSSLEKSLGKKKVKWKI